MLIFGINPVEETLRTEPGRIRRIIVARGAANPRLQRVINLARASGVVVHFEPPEALRRRSGERNPQNVLAEVAEVPYLSLNELLRENLSFLVLADGVEDPRNLGALIRTAEAVGVEALLLPRRGTCAVTPTVVKASAGTALRMRICQVGNVAETIQHLKVEGFVAIGLDMRGSEERSNIEVSGPILVVVGGEDRGLKRLVRDRCDHVVRLPMRGRVSSLNLSVAAGILLYEILVKRNHHSGASRPEQTPADQSFDGD